MNRSKNAPVLSGFVECDLKRSRLDLTPCDVGRTDYCRVGTTLDDAIPSWFAGDSQVSPRPTGISTRRARDYTGRLVRFTRPFDGSEDIVQTDARPNTVGRFIAAVVSFARQRGRDVCRIVIVAVGTHVSPSGFFGLRRFVAVRARGHRTTRRKRFTESARINDRPRGRVDHSLSSGRNSFIPVAPRHSARSPGDRVGGM